MKPTTWLCPVLTLLCATRLVCTAQRGGYALDYADSNMLQDDYMLEKRNKPSLSIVNPLDVLRQRLLLEIARRQMKENTRQVELNRAILKNVGKRVLLPSSSLASSLARQYQMLQHQLQQQKHPEQIDDYVPSSSIFDFLQRPALDALENDKKSQDIDAKHQLNGNEIVNETNHAIHGLSRDSNRGVSTMGHNGADAALEDDQDDESNNGDYSLRYLYRIHKNHISKK